MLCCRAPVDILVARDYVESVFLGAAKVVELVE